LIKHVGCLTSIAELDWIDKLQVLCGMVVSNTSAAQGTCLEPMALVRSEGSYREMYHRIVLLKSTNYTLFVA